VQVHFANELVYLLDNSDAEVLVFHRRLGDRVERVRANAVKLRAVIEVDDGDGAGEHLDGALRFADVIVAHEPMARIEGQPTDVYMLYTGGTTGMPKGVMYSHGVFPLAIGVFGANIEGIAPPTNVDELLALGDQLERPPVWLAACPQMHGTGMWLGTMAPHLLKGTVVTLTNRSFDAHELWHSVEREGVNTIVIVGDSFAKPMLRALDEGGYRAPSLRSIVSSGVMWSTEVKEGLLRHLDVMLYDGLGSTEGSMGATISTRAVFPEEVEEAVKTHPAVYDCLVVGIPDERFGERIVAVASLQPGSTAIETEILHAAGDHVARYKLPKQLVIVDRVQRAPNGKADYPWARRVAADASSLTADA